MKKPLYLLVYLVLTILSCIMLAYVSMASYLGPFIAPLIFVLYSKLFKIDNNVLLVQAACQGASLFCTAIGFVIPAIFFADKDAWQVLLENPINFCWLIFTMGITAGLLGTAVAYQMQITKTNPTSEMFFTMFQSVKTIKQDWTIFFSSLGSGAISLVRIGATNNILKSVSAFFFPTIFVIGFLNGTKVLLSLLIGSGFKSFFYLLTKYCTVYFAHKNPISLVQQFCVGTLAIDVIFGLVRALSKGSYSIDQSTIIKKLDQNLKALIQDKRIELFCVLILALGFLLFSMAIPTTLAILTLAITVISVFEMSKITIGIGLAPLGRFATFAMLGSMMFGQSSYTNILVSCFCAISCAAGANTILQTTLAKLADLDPKVLIKHHLIGLLLAAMFSGLIFIIFFKTINFADGMVLAQRGHMRALLMQNWTTEPVIILLGVITGIMFKYFKIEIALFFAGIIMSLEHTLVFVLGSLSAKLLKNLISKEKANEFCSGLLLGESVIIFLSMLTRFILAKTL